MKKPTKIFAAILMAASTHALAEGYCASDSSDGIILEEDRSRVVSVYRQPVKFLDRSGVRKASVIAEERAKGTIVRYFSQFQTTMRQVEETDQDGEEATRIVDSNGDLTTRSITRNQSAMLRQLDASFAKSNLKGILKVEEVFDKELSEVCVAVGYSAKSTAMVDKSKAWMSGQGGVSGSADEGASLKRSTTTVESYTRIRKDNW